MKTLKIEIPEGYEVERFDESSGEIKFREKPKKVTDRIKKFKDVLKELGIDKAQFDSECKNLEPDELAYRKVKLIVKALNEGWFPDWGNNEYKYYPWFNMGGSSGSGFAVLDYDDWHSRSRVGSRLCFKSRELAQYAATQFVDIYKEFLIS